MTLQVKKIWNTITSVLVTLVILVAVALVGVRLVGFQVYTVLSGSMEPEYPVGSLIYTIEVNPHDLQNGDDITFMLNENTIVTHRIIEVVPDNEDSEVLRFRTKGIANESEDLNLVHYKNVLGKPVVTIPYLGYVAHYVQHPPGIYIAIVAAAILFLLSFLPELLSKDEKENDNVKNQPKRDRYN